MKPLGAAVLLVFAVVAFRLGAAFSGSEVATAVANFSPVAALVLCSAAFFPRGWMMAVPIVALLVSDALLNLHYGMRLFTGLSAVLLVSFALIFGLGWMLRKRGIAARTWQIGLPPVLGASLLGSILFYLLTNTFSFFASRAYPPNLAGWWQCLTVGTPGFPPTYLFFLKSLAGDLVFTGLFLAVLQPFASSSRLPSEIAGGATPSHH